MNLRQQNRVLLGKKLVAQMKLSNKTRHLLCPPQAKILMKKKKRLKKGRGKGD